MKLSIVKLSFSNINSVNNNNNELIDVKRIQTIKLPNYYQKHGFIIKSINEDNCEYNEIELLLFGGDSVAFLESFSVVKVRLPTDIDTTNSNVSYSFENKNIVSNYYNLFQFDNDKIFDKLIENTCTDSTSVDCLSDFMYHLVKNRYLMIIGGEHQYGLHSNFITNIIYFDIKNHKWNICKQKIPKPLYGHCSVLSNDSKKLYIMGITIHGRKDINWTLNIIVNIKWNIARIFWIGFYKNEINKTNEMK